MQRSDTWVPHTNLLPCNYMLEFLKGFHKSGTWVTHTNLLSSQLHVAERHLGSTHKSLPCNYMLEFLKGFHKSGTWVTHEPCAEKLHHSHAIETFYQKLTSGSRIESACTSPLCARLRRDSETFQDRKLDTAVYLSRIRQTSGKSFGKVSVIVRKCPPVFISMQQFICGSYCFLISSKIKQLECK